MAQPSPSASLHLPLDPQHSSLELSSNYSLWTPPGTGAGGTSDLSPVTKAEFKSQDEEGRWKKAQKINAVSTRNPVLQPEVSQFQPPNLDCSSRMTNSEK